ncbi:Kiwa anti-phage protein KwaB-like domain-containing protein [Chryseobacterium indologenes]|uniref:Kiwa anti-phage protein KwaB-like domain-containing protein n=1 Tax=Chryseobacterium indologenes TaxID=253 RepID=UPI0014865654|nr:Kiwa anti-phage protein KwaB-like domain-containing protein [Chryseobacterium indologenes]
MQSITENIKNVFLNNATSIMTSDTEEILFDGNFKIDGDEVLYVEMDLPENVLEANTNAIGLEVLDITKDDIKTLFWIEDDIYYFQNFDKRKLLQNKNVIFYSGTTYHKLKEDALIVENMVNAIYKDGKFYFKSYANANKIISLSDFFEEASNETIEEFADNAIFELDLDWLKGNSDTMIRKQITLIQKSQVIVSASPRKIKASAKKFNLDIEMENGKLKLPNDKKVCKNILSFLNEQYYFGLISGKKFITNSKRDVS